jgi:flagellar biosynthetic protein FliQ
MTPETVVDIIRRALEAGGMVAGPILLVSLVAGVAVSILQATTQVNDMTLVFVPKILATLLALVLLGSWMLQIYIDFTRQMLLSLPALVG